MSHAVGLDPRCCIRLPVLCMRGAVRLPRWESNSARLSCSAFYFGFYFFIWVSHVLPPASSKPLRSPLRPEPSAMRLLQPPLIPPSCIFPWSCAVSVSSRRKHRTVRLQASRDTEHICISLSLNAMWFWRAEALGRVASTFLLNDSKKS